MLWLLGVALCVVVLLLVAAWLCRGARAEVETKPRASTRSVTHTKRLSCIAEGDEESDIEMRLVRTPRPVYSERGECLGYV